MINGICLHDSFTGSSSRQTFTSLAIVLSPSRRDPLRVLRTPILLVSRCARPSPPSPPSEVPGQRTPAKYAGEVVRSIEEEEAEGFSRRDEAPRENSENRLRGTTTREPSTREIHRVTKCHAPPAICNMCTESPSISISLSTTSALRRSHRVASHPRLIFNRATPVAAPLPVSFSFRWFFWNLIRYRGKIKTCASLNLKCK